MSRTRRDRIRCLFRVAAGGRLGFGHLMRARALARALGVRALTSLRGGLAARRAARAAGCLLADRVPTGALAAYDAIVVDDPSPLHARAWLARAARAGVFSLTIHDRGAGTRRADLIVDGCEPAPSSPSRRHLRGPRFCILDPRIERLRRRARRSVVRRRPRVVVALGGGAHIRRAGPALAAAIVRRCADADVRVAAGFVRRRPPALASGRWLVARRGLADALVRADVAVVGGGVTLSEACALGVPVVALAVVAGQRPAIRRYAARGAAIGVSGSISDRATAERAARAVARLLDDRDVRRRMARAGERLIDGRGAARTARHLRRLIARREGARRV